jgi:lysophospholipase L1-like esterase
MGRLAVKRLLLVLFSLVLGAALLEVGLRVTRATLHRIGYRAAGFEETGGRIVLCVGDSHTYGTAIPRDQAYPAQLEGYLNRVDPDGAYAVINRGVPGMNAAQVAHVLPSWLRQYRPDLVVVWAGANNAWNREDPGRIRSSVPRQSALGRAMAHSLVYRFWRNLRVHSRLVAASDDAERFMNEILADSNPWLGTERLSDPDLVAVTTTDLEHIAETLADSGREWILAAYPQSYPKITLHRQVATAIARRYGIEIVDTREDLLRAQSELPRARLTCELPLSDDHDCLLVNAMGPHPTGLLFRYIAESIGRRVLSRLGCAGPCRRERGRGTRPALAPVGSEPTG